MTKAKKRCKWVSSDPVMIKYHDKVWGVPLVGKKSDKKHFEFLTLEIAQAGLSWATALKRREGYRKAFAGYDLEKIKKFNKKKVETLMKDEGIIRNRSKIEAVINNAGSFLEIQKEFGSFSKYLWAFVDDRQVVNKWKKMSQIPSISDESTILSKDLKKRGFKFLGPTTLYAHMQAAGLVNDHTTDCFRYKDCINKTSK